MDLSTDADIYYARQVCKNILYVEANANVVSAEIAPWHQYVYMADAALILIAAFCVVKLLKNNRKKKEETQA